MKKVLGAIIAATMMFGVISASMAQDKKDDKKPAAGKAAPAKKADAKKDAKKPAAKKAAKKPAAKKAAPKKAAPKKAAPKKVTKAPAVVAHAQTTLNPQAAWPFPTASRP